MKNSPVGAEKIGKIADFMISPNFSTLMLLDILEYSYKPFVYVYVFVYAV